MDWDKVCTLYMQMKKYGVVIYGAGVRGKRAIAFMKRCNIVINTIADRKNVTIKPYVCIGGVEKLSADDNIVCVYTPLHLDVETKNILMSKFRYCVGMDVIDILNTHIPEGNQFIYRPYNHYESPFPSAQEVSIGARKQVLRDINLNLSHQKEFLEYISSNVMNFELLIHDEASRYNVDNGMYGYEDALVLYSMLNFFHPRRYIEIGSGWSTCLALDVSERCMNNMLEVNCIEPYPKRLLDHIHDKDKIVLHQDFVQNIEESFFEQLEKNDILFIDSSHVVKYGGDVCYEYFSILPRLKSGTIIHIHDIFKDFSYPKEWVSLCYTEAYVLRALLSNSDRYDVLYFNNMMHDDLCNRIGRSIHGGGSIWLRVR